MSDYASFDFASLIVDGILFSASLVHLPHDQVQTTLSRALTAFKNSGFLYVSLKEGEGKRDDSDGRAFYLWQDQYIKRVFEDLDLSVAYFERSTSAMGADDIWLGYVLQYEGVNN